MRLIPKNTRVKMQFYKGVTFLDIVLALVVLFVIAVVSTSNLPHKFIIAIGIVCVTLPMFLSVGEEKIYMSVLYIVKYLFSKKDYAAPQTESLIPYESIEYNYIKNKDGSLVGVIEIKPIEFRLLSENKQDYIIDTILATALESVGINQEAAIVNLQKPFCLDGHIQNELARLQDIVRNKENGVLTEKEYVARVDIIDDRMTLLDNLNSGEAVKYSTYYFVLIDKDSMNLLSCLEHIKQLFDSGGIEANVLDGDALADFVKLFVNGVPFEDDNAKSLQDIIPKSVEFKATNTLQDDMSLSHFVVCSYPLKVNNAWGEPIFNIPNTKVTMKLKPVEKSRAVKRIDNAIIELSTQVKGKASNIIDKSTHVETLSSLLERLQNDNETMFDVTLMITAYDNKGANVVKKSVKRRLRESGLSFNEMFGRQQDAYLTSELSFCDKVNISRGIQSTSIAACFPFVSDAIVEKDGIIIGENKLPVLVDFFKRDGERINSNMVIIGKSGSGKSYATKTLLTNLASCDTKIFILDPDDEYQKLASSLGGKVLDVASAKHGKLNPFQIILGLDDENDDGTKNSFFAHLQFLEEFFKLILLGINADCLELVNKLILELYVNKGITAETDFNMLSPQDYPIMDELAELIDTRLNSEKDEYAKSCLKILANYISKFKSGGRNSALWNGVSSFNAKENFVCFNFKKLLANKNNTVANAQMLLVLKWLENEVIKNRDYNQKNGTDRKVIVVIDEAHVFIDEKYPIALDFMYQLGKRIRKYSGMQIVITQNIKDFAGTAETARKSMAIINVSQYSLIFSLSPNDISDLCALYEKAGQINEAESNNIVYNSRGNAFLISSPSSRTNIQIIATPFAESLFNNEI